MLRMKIKSYILVILFSLSFAACEKEDNNGPKTDNDVNLWIERIMRENYLWYSELPEKNKLNFEDRKSTRLNSSHKHRSRMPSSA